MSDTGSTCSIRHVFHSFPGLSRHHVRSAEASWSNMSPCALLIAIAAYPRAAEKSFPSQVARHRIMFDPQTSGGLLIAADPQAFEKLAQMIPVWKIGEVVAAPVIVAEAPPAPVRPRLTVIVAEADRSPA